VPPDAAFDFYKDRGVVLEADKVLPGDSDVRYLENVLLSPSHNPFGPTHPDGIYVIDGRNKDIVIRNVRVLGTLMLFNLGHADMVTVTGSVNLAPEVPNYPSLMVHGRLTLAASQQELSEPLLGVNFNPPGTPFLGATDAVADDEYPSIIRSIVFVRREMWLSTPHTTVEGVVICRNKIKSDASAWLELRHRPTLAEDPPPGFYVPDGTIRVGAFTWEQVERPAISVPALPEG
jgi:hypothetical protein